MDKYKKYDYASKIFIILFSLSIILLSFFITPYMTGDGVEYTLMMESIENHQSLDLREIDIKSGDENYPGYNFTEIIGNGYRGYHESIDGKQYAAHFGLYSLLVLPIKIILKLIGSHQIQAFQIFNALLLSGTIFLAYKKVNMKSDVKFVLILLLSLNPIIYYLTWTHPEIFTYCLIVLAFAYMTNREYKKSNLLIGIAAIQNPVIISIGIIFYFDYLYFEYKRCNSLKVFLKSNNILRYFITGLYFSPFLIPILHTFIHFGKWNIVASVVTQNNYVLDKMFSYVFDLNIGILPYFPILLLICFIVGILSVITRINSFRTVLFFIGSLILVFLFSHQLQINSGMAGIMRYNIWLIPIMCFYVCHFLENCERKDIKKIFNSMLYLSILITLSITYFYGPIHVNYSSLEFNKFSQWVMNKHPNWYNPYHGIFISRATSQEGYNTEYPIIYADNKGYLRKILLSRENKELISYFPNKIKENSNLVIINKEYMYMNINHNYKWKFEYDEENIDRKVDLKSDIKELTLLSLENTKIEISITNLSDEILIGTTQKPIGISYHWKNNKGEYVLFENNRAYFNMPLYPTQTINMELSIIAPEKVGEYILEIDFLKENVAWYGDYDKDCNLIVEVREEK